MILRLCQTSGSLNSILSQFFSPTHLGVVKTSNLVKLRYRDASSGPNSKSRKPRTQGAIARYPAKASLRARRPMRRRFVAAAAACPSALIVFIVRPHPSCSLRRVCSPDSRFSLTDATVASSIKIDAVQWLQPICNPVYIVGGALRALARGAVGDTGRMRGRDNVGQAEKW